MPTGRTMGSTSAVAVDSRGHIWVAERCGANNCAGSPLDPILEFDPKGQFIKAFGGGMLLVPHGLSVDAHDHIWVTDGHSDGTKGAQVLEFDNSGKLLRALGQAGVSKEGPDTFAEPNAVLVAPNGTIFVADGHTPGKGAARIVKLDAQGRFLKSWGEHGAAPGQMDVPHTIALDSRGRLFVGDRWNNRIEIFDQDGKLLEVWAQFGRPSGLYIDHNDTLYVADSESRNPEGYGHHPGWARGIRIGSAKTGKVTAFIPDTEANPDKQATSGAEGIWVDRRGVIYGGQVLQKTVVRYISAR
jgi:sugar lactone lactonase YvrE